MMTDRKSQFRFPAGIVAAGLVAGIAGNALAQQRPISINQWLQAESGNVNMQRAIQEYERAQFGTATQPPAYQAPQYQAHQYQAPQYQAQAPQAAPQQPVQRLPQYQQPVFPQQQQPYAYQAQASRQIAQQQNRQNTNQPARNNLEKIDRDAEQDSIAAFANRGFYVGGHFGWSFSSDTAFDDPVSNIEPEASAFGFQMEGAAGYKMNSAFSLELSGSYNYTGFDETSGYASVFAIMPNARYEVATNQRIAPYISGGLGLGVLTAEDPSSTVTGSSSGLAVAWQFGIGAMYPVDLQTSLDFGYRYFATADVELDFNGEEYDASYGSHTFMVGIRRQI